MSEQQQESAVAPAPMEQAVGQLRESVERLAKAVEQGNQELQFKEEQIRRLHAELQEYKRGLLDQAVLPLLTQVIRLHENLNRQERALRQKSAEELGPDRVFKEIAGIRDELEVMLGESGVAIFEQPTATYDPARQIARETVPTANPAEHGTIKERILPGYERDGRLISKERVRVYIHQPATAPAPVPAPTADATPSPAAEPAATPAAG